jgi:O-antigen/teichoic acid export membrane protein
MRRAAIYLPVAISGVAIAGVALTRPSDGIAAVLLIAGAVTAIGALDLLARRGR